MATVKSLYKQARARRNNATTAIGIARRHIAGPLAAYDAAKKAWEAEPDKRRYAAGGSANRPQFPMLYSRCAHDDAVPDGYMLFGFLKSDNYRDGLSDSPDYGYYADSWQDATYYPCVLIRRTSERHVWACIPAYFNGMAEEFIFTDRNPRDLARSDELFDTEGNKETDGYSLAQDVKDAARTALSLAECDAEESREYDEKWQAANEASNDRGTARDELKQARSEARLCIAALRELNAQPAALTRTVICKQLQQWRDDMREALETIAEKTDAIAELDMQGEF